MHIKTLPTNELAKEAATTLNEICASQKGNFLFLSSGGSALALLEFIDPTNFGPHSTLCVSDERYSTDPSINNFAQLAATNFFKDAYARGAQVIDTTIREDETIEDVAARFEQGLRDWVNQTHGTCIMSAGIGPDAHTTGMMPYPEDPDFFNATFNSDNRWVVGYDAKVKNALPLRITITMPFIRMMDAVVIYVSGENKRPALEKLFADTGSLPESPCRIWREVSGAQLFTDQKI